MGPPLGGVGRLLLSNLAICGRVRALVNIPGTNRKLESTFYEAMKLRWTAAACVAPLVSGFVPARTAAARTAIVVRSEPIEINAPTVYSHWSANVNEEVFLPRL